MRLAWVFIALVCAAGCAHFATQQEKETSFLPFAQRRLGTENLREYIEQRTAVLVAGAKPLDVEVHQGQLGVGLKPMNGDGKVDISSAAAVSLDGYFLTAAHCVRRRPVFLLIYTPGGPLACEARVVWAPAAGSDCDLAVLKVSAALPAAFALAGESDVAVGQSVVTTGANGEAGGKLIAALLNDAAQDEPRTVTLLHDAPLAEGDSGGPLVTLDGKLIGVEVLVRGVYVGPRQSVALRPDMGWLRDTITHDRERKL